MQDTLENLIRRIQVLPEPHRRHALERLSHALEAVEEHAAEWMARQMAEGTRPY